MKNAFYNLLWKYHLKKSIKELRRLERSLPILSLHLAIPFIFQGAGFFKSIACMQNPHEIKQLYDLICLLKPQRVLEIGTAKGGALYLWLQAAQEKATVVSVDLPEGEFGGGYMKCRIPFYQSFARPFQKLHLVRADSHAESTFQKVRDAFEGEKIDFLFIDGDHTYNGVKHDFAKYGPLVRSGGIIVFHDILPRPDISEIQVDRFWKEIRDRYQTQEIIGPNDVLRKIGCGVLRVPDHGIMT